MNDKKVQFKYEFVQVFAKQTKVKPMHDWNWYILPVNQRQFLPTFLLANVGTPMK
jgi:hypothetical protein